MLLKEAIWIGNTIQNYFTEKDFPLLNVGSSTFEFRTKVQTHIHDFVFKPLQEEFHAVLHTDIKLEEGVDLAGDLNNPDFRLTLKGKDIRSILCSNLLEHLEDPQIICRSLLEVLDAGGLLLVTVPHSFPFHKDPIDTLFRPGIKDLQALFPGTELLAAEIVEDSSSYRKSLMANNKYAVVMLLRYLLPFYKFQEWKLMIRDLLNWNKKFATTCLLLRKKINASI